jgi:glutamyl-tRNA reductase
LNVALVFLGSSFRNSELRWLERLESASADIRRGLLHPGSPIESAVVLATCNRFEVYLETENFHNGLEAALETISNALGEPKDSVASQMSVLHGSAVSVHLFEVSSGLDSMIIGESEITGQVRKALTQAQQQGNLATSTQALFQSALKVSKLVSSSTGLGASGKSVVSTALQLAGGFLATEPPRRALIVGTGAYARVVTAAFKKAGVPEILIYSRSGRAESFAKQHAITAVADEDLVQTIATADLVVSASGSKGYVITAAMMQDALERRVTTDQLVIVDVALAKDVDPEVANLAGCYLLDLEQLQRLTPEEHSVAIDTAREMVRKAAIEFEQQQLAKSIDPLITALRADIGLWVDEELDSVRHRLDADTVTAIERSLTRVKNAILHTPTVKAKDLAVTGKHEDYVKAVRVLFDLELGSNG